MSLILNTLPNSHHEWLTAMTATVTTLQSLIPSLIPSPILSTSAPLAPSSATCSQPPAAYLPCTTHPHQHVDCIAMAYYKSFVQEWASYQVPCRAAMAQSEPAFYRRLEQALDVHREKGALIVLKPRLPRRAGRSRRRLARQLRLPAPG